MRTVWRRIRVPLAVLVILAVVGAELSGHSFSGGRNWGLPAFGMVAAALLLMFWAFEEKRVSSREIAVIAVLSTLAAVSRIPFAFLPNLQPVTFIVVLSGYVFGARAGIMVGITAALVSNFFLGQGPWTPWQMFAWGTAGATAGFLRFPPRFDRGGRVVCLFLWGYLFGWIMNLWFWTGFIRPLNWQTFLATYLVSAWLDTFHAAGNVVFYLVFGERFTKILLRFRKKLRVESPAFPAAG
ncbi:MAG: ECF transporter S component [Bacillota bacterium]